MAIDKSAGMLALGGAVGVAVPMVLKQYADSYVIPLPIADTDKLAVLKRPSVFVPLVGGAILTGLAVTGKLPGKFGKFKPAAIAAGGAMLAMGAAPILFGQIGTYQPYAVAARAPSRRAIPVSPRAGVMQGRENIL